MHVLHILRYAAAVTAASSIKHSQRQRFQFSQCNCSLKDIACARANENMYERAAKIDREVNKIHQNHGTQHAMSNILRPSSSS